jgi:hypothetical protein
MRRAAGAVLIVIGVVLLAVGIAAKPIIYDRLAIVSLDQRSTTVSRGEGMSALWAHDVDGASRFDRLTNATLQSTRQVIGIPGRVEDAGVADTDAFWQTTVQSSAQIDGAWTDLTYSEEGVSLNRRTGEATNCCGDYRSVGDLDNPSATEPVKHEGLFFKFPFDVQKQTYKWWDGDLQAAADMEYVEEQDLEGVSTFVFRQTTPKQEVGTRAVPKAVFGDSASGDVDARVMYGNVRTLWIEPNTGVVMKGVERLDKTLEAPGYQPVPTTVGTIGYNDETVSENVDTWGSKGRLLGFINGPLTWLGIIGGLLLIGAGIALVALTRGAPAKHAPTEESGLDSLVGSRN